MVRKTGSGIFCIEGEWGRELNDRRSVQPILELLERLDRADYFRRDVATRDEFFYYLKSWRKKSNKNYPVLYFACHGWDESIYLREESTREANAYFRGTFDEDASRAPYVELHEIEEYLAGKCAGRPIYFGSCSTMRADDTTLRSFAKKTGASAVVGYQKSVDWLDTASFEVMLLDHISHNPHNARFFSRIVKASGQLASDLGLVVATKTKVHRAS
jgi:hypothetical protein